MQILKKKIFWIILGIGAIMVGAVVFQSRRNQEVEYITDVVKRDNLVQTVSATGKVESATETNLNFKITGKLANLYVKAGQMVKRGQLLATLEAGKAQSELTNAQAQLAEAEADLEKVIAGSSDEEIALAQAKLNQAGADLNTKNTTLANLLLEKDQNLLSYKEQAIDEFNESLFLAQVSLEDVDEILYGEQKDNLKLFFSSYTTAENALTQAQTSLTSLDALGDNYSVESSVDDLVYLLNQLSDVLNQVNSTLTSTYDLLSLLTPIGTLTQTILDDYKSTINTDQTNLGKQIAAVQTAKANLQVKAVEYDNDIKEAEVEVQTAEAAKAVALAELNSVLADPRSFEVSLQQAKVKMAQAKVQSALADLGDYSLRAPIDGVITKVNYKVGEYVSSAEPVISLISESNLEIEVDVPEADIAKIEVGDEAKVTLDAFGDDQVFNSHLSFIDPAETVINDVVYYKVKLTFDEKNENVKSGMTANVVISTARVENVLTIPGRAVIEDDSQKYVRVLVNNKISQREVVTGLRGDGGLVEIVSGLTEGEVVITYIKNGK